MTTKSSDNTEAMEKLTLNCSEVEEQASSSTKDKGKAEVAEAVDDVNEKKLITLKTSDGIEFEVEEGVMLQSETIKHIIEDGCSENVIPLHNCNGKYLGLDGILAALRAEAEYAGVPVQNCVLTAGSQSGLLGAEHIDCRTRSVFFS
ncbi:hypothetical protein FRX31_031973 [Thalictrum thalictroides]|uniref:SKP1 component POZ domain-containing protein n=1 Tax=Thalictrum thalictroides TaxID=46969 RepID=A0A7J6V116_THATH|nr:hypothetical protein FRX31_031973 [Thalictrum thalictroides]